MATAQDELLRRIVKSGSSGTEEELRQLVADLATTLPQLPQARLATLPVTVDESIREAELHDVRATRIEKITKAAVEQGLLDGDQPVADFFSLPDFRQTAQELLAAFPEPFFMHAMAVKANPMRGVLLEARRMGLGAEAATIPELRHARSLGFPSTHVVYDSPCKAREHLVEAVAAGVQINLDNYGEVEKLSSVLSDGGAELLAAAEATPRFGVRINPVVGSGTISVTSTANLTSKFGIAMTADTRQALLETYIAHRWLRSVHCHVGSQGCAAAMLVEGARAIVAFALDVNRAVGWKQVAVIDIGGGLPVDYHSDDPLLPLAQRPASEISFGHYSSLLRSTVPELFSGDFRVLTEFGRALVAKSGWTAARVEAVKPIADRQCAVIHVGADQFVRTAYQPELWPLRVSVFSSDGSAKPAHAQQLQKQDVTGPLCFSGDFVCRERFLPAIQPGDVLTVHDSGAYTVAMTSRYNSITGHAAYSYDISSLEEEGEETGGGGGGSSSNRSSVVLFWELKRRETPEEALVFWGWAEPKPVGSQ